MTMITPSSKKEGHYQVTYFDRKGEPFGDTLYPSREQALNEFLKESDLRTVQGTGQYLPEYRTAAPRDEALRIAQANAAKPISEGGLGLRPDNTPMERAQAMGFDTPTYRGTTADEAQSRPGIYSTGNIDYANKFAKHEGANVIPLMISRRNEYLPANQSEIEQIGYFPELKQEMLNRGVETVSWVSPNRIDRGASGWGDDASQFYSLNPANVRSRFAAFDPARRYQSDLLGAANPALLGAVAAGTGAGVYGYNRQKEKEKRSGK